MVIRAWEGDRDSVLLRVLIYLSPYHTDTLTQGLNVTIITIQLIGFKRVFDGFIM